MSKRLTPPTEEIMAASLQAAEDSLGQSGCDAIAIAVVMIRPGTDGQPESRCVIAPPHVVSSGAVAASLFLAAKNLGTEHGIHFPDPVPVGEAHRQSQQYRLGQWRGKGRVN